MAIVKILHSTVAGHAPSTLVSGQVGINEADGIFFWLDADGTTIRSYNLKNPTAPTQTAGDSSTKVASTAFVAAAVAALNTTIVSTAPTALNTLAKIASSINNDASFSATINTALGLRLRVDGGQSLTSAQKTQGRSNLGLATVASSGAYTDLTGTPTLGAAAAKNTATSANIVADSGTDVLTTDQVWAAAGWTNLGNLSGTVTLNANSGTKFYGTLVGAITLAVTGLKSGQLIDYAFAQDGTGGRTISFSGLNFPSSATPPVQTAAGNWALIGTIQAMPGFNVLTGYHL